MVLLIQEKLRNNDSYWFRSFTDARRELENFLLQHKSLIGMVLQNLGKGQRVPKMKDMFAVLIQDINAKRMPNFESVMSQLGVSGKLIDIQVRQASPRITDETKATLNFRDAISNATYCPICGGMLDPRKSVSYDHKIRIEDGGTGDIANVQRVHPYCNTGYKEAQVAAEKKESAATL